MNGMFREVDYKLATIEWLLERGVFENDAVLINELPVDNFNRRADLVVANGKLHAFEIKSDFDSLTRLNGQVNTYLSFFDKVTVVCSSKYTKKILEALPQNVEVLEFNARDNGTFYLKTKRRGRTNEIKNHINYLSFVEKKYLVSSLKCAGIACNVGESRRGLYSKFDLLPRSFWRSVVLKYLKNKYRLTHDAFFNLKGESVIANDLSLLSPQKYAGGGSNAISEYEFYNDFNNIELDKAKNIYKYGLDISESMYKFGFVSTESVHVIPRVAK